MASKADALAKALDAFLAGHAAKISAETRAAILAAISDGNIALAASYLTAVTEALPWAQVRDAIRDMVVTAAAATAPIIKQAIVKAGLNSPANFVVSFDMLNPRTVGFIQQYEFNLIKQISEPTVEGIRSIIEAGMKAGRNPNAVARDVRQLVGLTKAQAKWVTNFRSELETFHQRTTGGGYNLGAKVARTPGGLQAYPIDPETGLPIDGIFERRLRDFRYDKTLQNAMTSGKPLSPEQIDKMVDAYARKLRAWRSRMIARTEAARANQMGAQLMWKQAADNGLFPANLVRRYWITAQDERVRLSHRPIPGMNPEGVGLDDMFNTPLGEKMAPPIAPNCRCGVIHRLLEPGMDPAEYAPQ